MAPRSPLSTLLSQALVAFTIELDNEAEHQMPHRTTEFGRTTSALPNPWLVSLNMYFNCLRHVPEQGIRLSALRRQARTGTNLNGMQRWGYIYLAPDRDDPRAKPPKSQWMVLSTPAGRRARQVCETLLPAIEDRWRQRFGPAAIDQLRLALARIARQLPADLPDCLPIVGYGLFSNDFGNNSKKDGHGIDMAVDNSLNSQPLPALLARVLLAFAADFEREATVSMAISANILERLDEKPSPVRDLPALAGISAELTAVATGWLARHGFAVIQKAPPPDRGQQVRLNEKGLLAQDTSRRRHAAVESDWQSRFGQDAVADLRACFNPIVGDGTAENSPLFEGLDGYPDGWRAKVKRPKVLPAYPLVSHRGGFPDGS